MEVEVEDKTKTWQTGNKAPHYRRLHVRLQSVRHTFYSNNSPDIAFPHPPHLPIDRSLARPHDVQSKTSETMSTPMMSRVATRTPAKSTPQVQSAAPVVDSPGTWRHPRIDEISRRRNATTFSEKNVRKVAQNVAFFVALWVAQALVQRYISHKLVSESTRSILGWAYLVLKTIPIANSVTALLPLFRTTDDLSDIPLSAAQRQQLGLPPGPKVATPDAVFSTPPRYSRTPSLAGSPASNRSYASSPLSGRGSPAFGGNLNGSSFSPASSPSKFAGGLNENRRSSFGSPSPLPSSGSSGLFADPTSPSPSTSKRTSVGLNNKWLYERGRRSSTSLR
ncbi:hypothetical protein VdG1_05683 [Verticillium dahliae VDG1]|nr:hypothetical protein VdG1_05683 [Verticillium dahliae VDG1]